MPADSLGHLTRPATGDAEGLLVLFHGRGADERDLYPLLDLLDPRRRLHGGTPRGPLHLPPGGAHWYAVKEIGYPDPPTFTETLRIASAWLDDLASEVGAPAERMVLGGFSQGAVMTYALSGFMPSVPGFQIDLETSLPRVAIGHGVGDPVISVDWGRDARTRLENAGADLTYHESPSMGHSIDPAFLRTLPAWLDETMRIAA